MTVTFGEGECLAFALPVFRLLVRIVEVIVVASAIGILADTFFTLVLQNRIFLITYPYQAA